MAVHSSALLPPSFSAAERSKPKLLKPRSLPFSPLPIVSLHHHRRQRKTLRILASVSVSNPEVRTSPDDLVASILSKVYPFTSFSARMSCFVYIFLYFPKILFVPIMEAVSLFWQISKIRWSRTWLVFCCGKKFSQFILKPIQEF